MVPGSYASEVQETQETSGLEASRSQDDLVKPCKLVDLLWDFRRLSATDPRDKIYATLGLATDAIGVPHVNYGLSPAEVFRSLAAFLVRKGDGIRVLHATISHPQRVLLPSWVPDWTSQACLFEPLISYLAPRFQAGGNAVSQFKVSTDESCIKVWGGIADRICFKSR